VQEYALGILNRIFLDEAKHLPLANYMKSQADINNKMRGILIDWLIEVHMKYRLRSETLHLTVNLIDRYLTNTPVTRKRLQLVGVTAMFIASKYEEMRPPQLQDWVYITDSAYTKEDVLLMECSMLTSLNFHITVPTAAHFFEALQKANSCDDVHREVAQYFLELGLLDMRLLQYTPSHMVAAAMLLSNELLRRNPVWPAAMVQQSRNSEHGLRGCAEDLRQLLGVDRAGTSGLQAVHKKFSAVNRLAVADMKF
jgi:cyclin B